MWKKKKVVRLWTYSEGGANEFNGVEFADELNGVEGMGESKGR